MDKVVNIADYGGSRPVVKGEAHIDTWSHIHLLAVYSDMVRIRDAGVTEMIEPTERMGFVIRHQQEQRIHMNDLVEKAIANFQAEEERKGHIPSQPSFDSSSVEKVYDQKVVVLRNVNGVLAGYAVGEGDKLTRLDEEEESKIE